VPNNISAGDMISCVNLDASRGIVCGGFNLGANGYANFTGQLTVTNADPSYPVVVIGGDLSIFGGDHGFQVHSGSTSLFGGLYVDGTLSGDTPATCIWATGDIRTIGDIYAANVSANNLSYETDVGSGEEAIALKSSVASSSGQDILKRLAHLDISTWSSQKDPTTPHVGPKAHDFQAAFGLGNDDKTISLVDESGVALAAIQGLNQKLNEKDAEIQELKRRVDELKQLVQSLAEMK
jgi:hypothetical protein